MRAAILLLAGGCSFAMTSSPEPHRPCPTSQPAPYIDAAAAVGLAVLSVALVVRSDGDYAESDTASIATLSGLGAGLYALAATRGFTNLQSCREHHDELAEEALAEQQRKAPRTPRTNEAAWQLTKQAAASARAGHCAAVAGADRALRDLDADFHATVFVRDAAIARCLRPLTPMPAAAPAPSATEPAVDAPGSSEPAVNAPGMTEPAVNAPGSAEPAPHRPQQQP